MESILLVIAALVIVFNLAFIAGALWANWTRSIRADEQSPSSLSDPELTALTSAPGGQATEALGKTRMAESARRSHRPSPDSHVIASRMRRN